MDIQPGDTVTLQGTVRTVIFSLDQPTQFVVETAGGSSVVVLESEIQRADANKEASV